MSEPVLSIVIPAYNEARRLGGNLAALHEALPGAGISDFEIIVSDDASTDATARIAVEGGARVVPSGKRNIAATRNVGAAQAKGRYILFVDADTRPPSAALAAMMRALDAGAVGGGALLCWIETVRLPIRLALAGWNAISRLFRMPAGGFLFVRRDVFEKLGGFDERFYAGEELYLAQALKRQGRVVILRDKVATSAYKLERYSALELARQFLRALASPRRALKDRRYLDFWYQRRG